MIVTQQARSLIPSQKPLMFSRDVVIPIIRSSLLTESKVDNPKECLYVLDQHTSGKAKELIKGCFLMKNKDSYKVAKRLF